MSALSPPARADLTSPHPQGGEKERRAAIDFIATTRARAVRVALFGQMAQRHAEGCRDLPASMDACVDQLDMLARDMERASALLKGDDPGNAFAPEIVRWFGHHADLNARIHDTFAKLIRLTRDVGKAARDLRHGNTAAKHRLDAALKAHFDYGRNDAFQAVTTYCDELWSSLDAQRDADLARSRQASEAITSALTKLDRIGRHVRLVSINASVEASRAGEAGQGLAVIATEFKSLSEDIQKLAAGARFEIDNLL